MSINLGVALGAGAKSALDTYQTLDRIRWEQEQRGQMRQAWARENARNAAIGNASNQTVDPSDAQSLSDYLDNNYSFSPDQRDQLVQGITADPTKAASVLQAYGSYRKSSFGTPVTQPTDPNAPQARAMPQAIPGAGAPQGTALQAPVPGMGTSSDNPSTQGALPSYTGQAQDQQLPPGVTLDSYAAQANQPTQWDKPTRQYVGPALRVPAVGVTAKPDTWPPEGSEAPAPAAVENTTIPGAQKAPAPAANAPQPIDATKPQVNSQGIDLNSTHAYLGHDGKVYLASSTPRKLSPGELQRAIAINLMKLPDAEAAKEGSAMLQQSYTTSKEEHDYQVDQIVQQAASSGDIAGALKKLPGVLSDSNLVPGSADVKMATDGKSVTYTLNVPGGKPVVQTVTGDNPIDLLAKAAMGLKGMFNPSVYNQATANNLKAQEVLAQQTHANAAMKSAETAASEAPSKIKMNEGAAQYYADHGQYMVHRAQMEKKTPTQIASDYADAVIAADPTVTRANAMKMGMDAVLKTPAANQNKDLSDSEKIGLQSYQNWITKEGGDRASVADDAAMKARLGISHLIGGNALVPNSAGVGAVKRAAGLGGALPPPGGSFFGNGSAPAVKPSPQRSVIPQPAALPTTAIPQTSQTDAFDLEKAERYDMPLVILKRGIEAAAANKDLTTVQGYSEAYQKRVKELRAAGTYGR